MSTRSTIWYDPDSNWHLYWDGFDRDHVYLQFPMPGSPLVGTHDNGADLAPALRIPLHIFKGIVFEGVALERLKFVGMSEERLRAEAEAAVDEHRAYLEAHKDSRIFQLMGVLTFGPPESTREEMIESYIESTRYTGGKHGDQDKESEASPE